MKHLPQPNTSNAGHWPLVTLLVPMRDEEEFIGDCLDSLIEQDYPSDRMEVLVIDGRSEDASRSIVQKKSHEAARISLLDNPLQVTTAALNTGIRNSQGDVIIRLDAHHVAASDFVSSSVECLRDREVDCVGGPISTFSRSFVGRAVALAMSCPFGVGNAFFRYSEREQFVDTVANAGYRREVFERVGLFDEELACNEDDEFNYRLRAAGGRILLCPQIRSRYACRDSLGKLWGQYFRYGYWKVRVLQKHPRQMSWRQFVPPAFVLSVAGALGLAALGFSWPLAVVVGSYVMANLAASLWVAGRSGLQYSAILPVAFAILHLSYGLGFLKGLLDFANEWSSRESGYTADMG